ncbi:hypothetical protein LEP1GSC062_2798 [Leptospira alexanderi serovar Manhao 3 str. L 60]|uniref:Uncharacterized protein n=1 Tax=Leptospira alexanderi serovar Manhao 3 str. L 60 TaxID=1049759 RepID=V6IC05_9LEPT|nr:hypothetical protein LEP1GSC062_2798 [Leptospira alexanderi serovar Manhao 3 str. L 60]
METKDPKQPLKFQYLYNSNQGRKGFLIPFGLRLLRKNRGFNERQRNRGREYNRNITLENVSLECEIEF